jgi:cytoskeletal protein RodZ
VSPGGGSGWDEPPLDIQVPDDARELDRDVLAYHRELRAKRRRRRLRRLTAPVRGQGTVMPLLASILAVCLVAGAMLSVATFSPATAPGSRSSHPPTAAASSQRPVTQRSTASPAATRPSNTAATRPSNTAATRPSNTAATRPSNTAATRPSNTAATPVTSTAATRPSNTAAGRSSLAGTTGARSSATTPPAQARSGTP